MRLEERQEVFDYLDKSISAKHCEECNFSDEKVIIGENDDCDCAEEGRCGDCESDTGNSLPSYFSRALPSLMSFYDRKKMNEDVSENLEKHMATRKLVAKETQDVAEDLGKKMGFTAVQYSPYRQLDESVLESGKVYVLYDVDSGISLSGHAPHFFTRTAGAHMGKFYSENIDYYTYQPNRADSIVLSFDRNVFFNKEMPLDKLEEHLAKAIKEAEGGTSDTMWRLYLKDVDSRRSKNSTTIKENIKSSIADITHIENNIENYNKTLKEIKNNPPAGVTDFKKMVEVISKDPRYDGYVIANNSLRITTKPIEVAVGMIAPKSDDSGFQEIGKEYYDVGRFSIVIDSRMSLSIYGLGDHKQGHPHPHVLSNGSICAGNLSDMFQELLKEEALGDLIPTVFDFLESYNHNSPYVEIENWEKLREVKHATPIDLAVTNTMRTDDLQEQLDNARNFYVRSNPFG